MKRDMTRMAQYNEIRRAEEHVYGFLLVRILFVVYHQVATILSFVTFSTDGVRSNPRRSEWPPTVFLAPFIELATITMSFIEVFFPTIRQRRFALVPRGLDCAPAGAVATTLPCGVVLGKEILPAVFAVFHIHILVFLCWVCSVFMKIHMTPTTKDNEIGLIKKKFGALLNIWIDLVMNAKIVSTVLHITAFTKRMLADPVGTKCVPPERLTPTLYHSHILVVVRCSFIKSETFLGAVLPAVLRIRGFCNFELFPASRTNDIYALGSFVIAVAATTTKDPFLVRDAGSGFMKFFSTLNACPNMVLVISSVRAFFGAKLGCFVVVLKRFPTCFANKISHIRTFGHWWGYPTSTVYYNPNKESSEDGYSELVL